ncbi:hypothetical protein AYO21_09522 [Fonsecaea monophora]|uniref:Uncharacterized protein n=1 Tax=Fonsecaea monophora TaxID=254056 RepID=A0A177EYD4_9EURO|nr:hypothetical protein AYO21_09522 [Fonsecaea monophora]OAG36280.1 hypothetical protein AYO21_09522 [Fonsecaea monophora]
MADQYLPWQLVNGDIRIKHTLGGAEVDMTWSSNAPRREYIATSNLERSLVYFFSGPSIDIAEALLYETSGELDPTFRGSLERHLKEHPQQVVQALVEYLSPWQFTSLRIICTDHSYWRVPGTFIPSFVVTPKEIVCDPLYPQYNNFTPRNLLQYAHPYASKEQLDDVIKQYNDQWTQMYQQQNQGVEQTSAGGPSMVQFHPWSSQNQQGGPPPPFSVMWGFSAIWGPPA